MERRGRFRVLAKRVGEMTDDERAALVAKVGAIVTCEGRALSVHNTCLVLNQLPTASMIGGFWLVRRGISPVNQLRTRLGAVRDGRARRLEGSYPSEVQPLVDDLNALLDHREQTIRRALAKAGDLAHGLKTPLAVLAHEADRAAAAGHSELADAIGQQVERMRRQTEYHLAQARAVASGATAGAQCSVVACTEGLIRTVQRCTRIADCR